MTKIIFTPLLVCLLTLSACTPPSTDSPSKRNDLPETMMPGTPSKESTMKSESTLGTGMIATGSTVTSSAFNYMTYSDALFRDSIRSGKTVVLFFHASWCPTCKALDEYINTHLGEVPMNAIILKVDYDSSDELKKKYGVTTQHTSIVLDRDGNTTLKKLGVRTIADLFTP